MPYATFEALSAQVRALVAADADTEALQLLEREGGSFPENALANRQFQFLLHCKMGNHQTALDVLERCLTDGLWMPPQFLSAENSTLGDIVELPRFEDLRERSASLRSAALAQARPELTLRRPENADSPLLYVLHGNTSTSERARDHWGSATESGWLLATPQSSQLMAPNRFGWNDRAVAEAETSAHLQELGQTFDPVRVVVGGFSRGAGLGVVSAFSGLIPATGFIAVSPVFPEFTSALLPHVSSARERGLRGHVIVGDDDPYREQAEALAAFMAEHALPCQMVRVQELSHRYPDDFGTQLRDMLRAY